MYGSTRDYSILDEHTHLNDGLGEGVSYRGRILVAIRTDLLDSMEGGPANVEVETTLPVSEVGQIKMENSNELLVRFRRCAPYSRLA